jgi:MoxR-like ATPase
VTRATPPFSTGAARGGDVTAGDDTRAIEAELHDFRTAFTAIQARLQETIVGQDQIVQGVLMAVFLGGHVLLEGVPGLGKTLLVTTLGDTLGMRHSRVQFTPDLMPADIIGTRIIKQDATGSMHFEFERGPVFTQLLLADEINRATPKTQSALLEAMQERRVTVAGQTYPLPEPFAVLATQNPLEQEGTYPLPEAQLDRFLFKLLVRFPTQLELVEIMKRTTGAVAGAIKPLVDSTERILRWNKLLRRVPIGTAVLDYGARVLLATHPSGAAGAGGAGGGRIRAGASPRGLQSMILAAKLRAVLAGRFTVTRPDLVEVAKPCLRHRILLTFDAEAEGVTADQVIEDILQRVT